MWHTDVGGRTHSKMRSAARKRWPISDLRLPSAHRAAAVVKALDSAKRKQSEQLVMHMGRSDAHRGANDQPNLRQSALAFGRDFCRHEQAVPVVRIDPWQPAIGDIV